MKSTFKRLAAIGLFGVLGGLSFVVASCGTSSCSGKGDGSTQGNGFFAAENGHYVLTDDYVVTAEDIEGMGGTDGVTLSSSCTFDLRGHTLDLNGYALNIASDGAQVEIKDGTVANGRLNIAIPDGEVRFADATFTDSLSCEIGASGNAVTFDGVSMYGPCTVQSECSLNMTDSNVSDITLTEKAELVAGVRADIAQIRADSSARGAAVSITPGAEVGAIALESSAEVTAAGLVGDITVSGGAASSAELPKIDVLKSGAVDRLRLDSAAEVSICGYISSLALSEAADGGSASAITIGSEGSVTGLTLNASARVDIEGHVSALTVGSSATDEPSELVLTIAEHSGISNASINSAVDMTLDSIVYRMMVAQGAEGSNLTFGQNAGMGYIAVLAEGVSISKVGNGNVYIYVAEGADTSLFDDAITVYTSTQQNIDGLFAHEHAFTVSSRTAPTCTSEGVIEEECACGERQETKIAATGHSYEYSVVRQPSASQDGMGRYTCIYCGATQDVPIKPSASLTIDGLNALYGLIPDGVYTFRTMAYSPFTVVSGGNTLELQFVITVRIEDGNMSAECDGSAVNTYANGNVADIQFKAISDGSTIFIYQLNADDDTDMIEGDSISCYAIGAILNSIYPLQTNFDADELYNDYLSVFVNQDGTAADTLLSDLTEKLISSAFDAEENADGSRTYSLNAQALHAVLEETGDGSVAMALDGLFGDGTAADIEGYLDGIEYKKASDIVGYALSVADKMGMGKQQLYAILGNALSEFSDTTIDFDALVLIYGDKPLAEAVRQYLIDYNGTSYDEEYVAFMISLLADNIGSLLNSKVSQVLTAENIPELPFDYAQLVAAVGKYGKDVGLTFTLDANDNLIAFDVTYMASVTGSDGITATAEIFSASWKEGDAVPQISFDYDGAVASVEESEDGEITVSVSLMGTEHVAMFISKSQDGLQLSVTVNSADGGKRLVDLSAEYISDGEGGELTIGGTLDGTAGGEVNIEGTIAVGKGDSSQSDTGASGEVSDLKDILYRADITLNKFSNPDNGTLRLEYATDERGEFYRVTDTAVTYYITDSFAMGGVTYYIGIAEKIEKILRVDCIDGLPDIICSCSDDCDGWIYLNIVAVGRAEIYRTRTEGVFIKQEDGSYVAVRKDSEDRLREDIFYPSSGNDALSAFAYYNPVTGESSPSTAHKFSFSGRLQEGSTSCEDGAEVTATCTVCGYSYTYYKQGQEMTTVEEHSIATQCDADTTISVSRCSVCGYELISDNMTSPTGTEIP